MQDICKNTKKNQGGVCKSPSPKEPEEYPGLGEELRFLKAIGEKKCEDFLKVILGWHFLSNTTHMLTYYLLKESGKVNISQRICKIQNNWKSSSNICAVIIRQSALAETIINTDDFFKQSSTFLGLNFDL